MNKIPKFPKFKKLELSDEESIENLVKACNLQPYADFNFINIWSWDIHEKMMVSMLNGNLVVLFNDYVTNEHFLSFFGKENVVETANELIEYSNNNYRTSMLKLIPEEIAKILSENGLLVKEDRDSFDYMYSIVNLKSMKSWNKKDCHYKNVHKFLNAYPKYSVKHLKYCEIDKGEYLEMFKKWSENKGITHSQFNEYKAIERFFMMKDNNAQSIAIYINNKMIGFTFYEIVSKNYAVAHFSKADTKYHSAIYDVLNLEEAKVLSSLGVVYYDWEQDLGIPGLRHSKESYHPEFFLKKFTVSK